MKYQNILETIGNTPHIRLNKLFKSHEVWIKLEKSNPGSSIKDRIALAMIEDAEKKGLINEETTIIEPTSGNTGIGLSLVAAVKGYKVIVVMPESMSVERRRILNAYGAEFILTPREKGTSGAVERAKELAATIKNSFLPSQFTNKANVEIHEKTTALEILADFPDGIDYLITGVGTGGHITGVSKILKQHFPNLKTFAVEPALSPVLSGGLPAPHPFQGIGAGFIPEVFNREYVDQIITVDKNESYTFTKRIAKEEGIFAGISTGAALSAIAKKLKDIPENAVILTFNYDTGERYLSIDELFD
ncbi:cysteine synthase [Flavobacterium aquidurense]|uniref:Cysteine synthase n=1 Tax=Flavobacterium frigidimaris TaxID=262320 RepID=A0ABX4BTF2_FLAFR|nr:cysteine synthase A [Flavobacterium frigidimaris]OXA80387.1 cysteine synthase A [Flavobacterium frigidimaris]SDY75230.1 cysteine synthase [Flavobacterium aquidurense]